MNIGGLVVAAQGLPDLRVWPRVETITICALPALEIEAFRAEVRSSSEVGVPLTVSIMSC